MKRLSLLLTLSLLISITACKTQEDIRREKTVENLNEQVVQTQKNTANASVRFNAIEEQLSKLTGQIEETGHSKQQEIKDVALLKERLQTLEETSKKQTEYLRGLNEKLQEQSKYIDQVIKSLSVLNEQREIENSKKKEIKESKDTKDSKDDNNDGPATVKNGISKFKAHDLEAAKEILLSVLETKKVKKKDKETSYHYLGMIEYKDKNYEEAKVYFSKLYSENPDSQYAAAALLNLAKSFHQLKSKEEARQSLEELISRFPKSKEAHEANKLKAKL